jgi:CSLREA domain-containing protein
MCCLFLVSPVLAGGTTTVKTTADELNNDGDCSLRAAIQAINTGVAVDACLPTNPISVRLAV